AFPSPSTPKPGVGRIVPGWRDPPPRAPDPPASRLLGAHAASVSPAPQAVGTGRVALEDVGTVGQAEGFLMLDLARFPGDPEDGRPSIGALARRSHSCSLLSVARPRVRSQPAHNQLPSPGHRARAGQLPGSERADGMLAVPGGSASCRTWRMAGKRHRLAARRRAAGFT